MSEKLKYKKDGYLVKSKFFEVKKIKLIYKEITTNNFKVQKILKNFIDAELIDRNNITIENNKIKYLKNPQIYFKSINYLIQSSLFSLAEKLITEKVYIDTVELHQKYPGASNTPPHQDNFYFCLEKGKALTIYIPLNTQNFKNGALAVIPGSHNFDLEHYSSKVPGFSSGIILNNAQKSKIKHYSLKAGDLSIHHCNIVHLAPPNTSHTPRINVAIRFRSLNEKLNKKKFKRYLNFRKSSVRLT